MCSYNRVNGDYACDNKYLLTDVLKQDWKFPGFVLSDWGAAHSIAKLITPDQIVAKKAVLTTACVICVIRCDKPVMNVLSDISRRVISTSFAKHSSLSSGWALS